VEGLAGVAALRQPVAADRVEQAYLAEAEARGLTLDAVVREVLF
jgi:hypothetical protein